MNIDQSSFDVWLQNDVTKVLLEMCQESVKINQQKILSNGDFSAKAFCLEVFYKGGISAIVEHVIDFDLEDIENYLKSKKEIKDAI